jgi:hypothetical protein
LLNALPNECRHFKALGRSGNQHLHYASKLARDLEKVFFLANKTNSVQLFRNSLNILRNFCYCLIGVIAQLNFQYESYKQQGSGVDRFLLRNFLVSTQRN